VNALPNEHVPLANRLALVQILRVFLAVAVFAVALIDGDQLDLAPLVAAYLALTGLVEVLRRRAPAVTQATSSWMLLLDGVFLALAVALTGGTDSRLLPLVFFHVTAVTLVVSYRTGLELAVWYALLLFVGHAAADAALYAAKREGRDRSVRSTRAAEPDEAPVHPSLRRGV
jgi:hypothetical protein